MLLVGQAALSPPSQFSNLFVIFGEIQKSSKIFDNLRRVPWVNFPGKFGTNSTSCGVVVASLWLLLPQRFPESPKAKLSIERKTHVFGKQAIPQDILTSGTFRNLAIRLWVWRGPPRALGKLHLPRRTPKVIIAAAASKSGPGGGAVGCAGVRADGGRKSG